MEYTIFGHNGVMFDVTEEELYGIANLWINDWNDGNEDEEDMFHEPNGMDDVLEILEEYMKCEVMEKYREYYEVEDMYSRLLNF